MSLIIQPQKIMIKKVIPFLLFVFLFSSCVSKKEMLYLQTDNGPSTTETTQKFETTLQPDDIVVITVTAAEPLLANDFNLLFLNSQSTQAATLTNNEALYSYTIDQNGEIDFPKLGKLKLAGLTRIQAEEKIKKELEPYITNAGVILKVLNFEVSVLGEVARPGTQRVAGDRITILEALSGAGDMTIYGKRKEVMVVREKDGVKTIDHVDITDPNLINSPYYYLAHNDVIIVKPNKTRINSSAVGPNLTIGISALSLLVTIIALSTR